MSAANHPSLTALQIESYQLTDPFFGTPYIDRDEWRDTPIPHRHVHGGFADTDTRFSFYFPPAEHWKGRMFHPIEGGHAGHEDFFGGYAGQISGTFAMIQRMGGYMIESNSGHIGDDIDPKGGEDPTLYGHRASIESARFSRFIAEQVYGKPVSRGYVWGGSGGGRRSPLCLEYGAGVYDGAVPYMGGGNIDKHGTRSRVRSDQPIGFGSMFNVQRLLGDKLASVIDAMQPGGGDPYASLTAHQREELANLYRLGYPRGDEFMISQPMGQMWLWTSIADMLQKEDADYFKAFWTKPGYVGHDNPEHVANDLINVTGTISRIVTAREFRDSPDFAGPEFANAKPFVILLASLMGHLDLPIGIEVKGIPQGYRLGSGVKVLNGGAAGRQLYTLNHGGDFFFCEGHGEANLKRFMDVKVGDQVQIDNRAFLAFCYYYRHHISDDSLYDFLRVDGKPMYPQHGVPLQSPLMGVPYSGQYEGKLMWVHHTHDASLWPPQGLFYKQAVEQAQGPEQAAKKFCLRWTQNAEHIPPAMTPQQPGRNANTWLVNYHEIIEQCLWDMIDWVENGVEPLATAFTFADGKVTLPDSAAQRGGIQPVVKVDANGASRAELKTGGTVALKVHAEIPAGTGAIISVEWDFDGLGSYPEKHQPEDKPELVEMSTSHRYDQPGVYFVTARVTSHRGGDLNATNRRIENVASARVVVS
ncbi:MAG: hypothetical protein VR73_15460 [Gammaproteobacteria bacterium BRH_c0]|nr:MAG: hypothetical protein VR73_15460 [Gammaproteobacteria bacterium BRH_c0]